MWLVVALLALDPNFRATAQECLQDFVEVQITLQDPTTNPQTCYDGLRYRPKPDKVVTFRKLFATQRQRITVYYNCHCMTNICQNVNSVGTTARGQRHDGPWGSMAPEPNMKNTMLEHESNAQGKITWYSRIRSSCDEFPPATWVKGGNGCDRTTPANTFCAGIVCIARTSNPNNVAHEAEHDWNWLVQAHSALRLLLLDNIERRNADFQWHNPTQPDLDVALSILPPPTGGRATSPPPSSLAMTRPVSTMNISTLSRIRPRESQHQSTSQTNRHARPDCNPDTAL
ncbi:hypothetical protein N658DRAFT_186949 [Parathielavia hyrcaniae]|uniref:Uncharacterized protein n=1 Tax=Parathielavia hyrcaniae TaxID=113614 RepID=A0AAN6Q6X6_9PEZI|nr:hypothetical protein N658DRAFT_186949 [Parathielavia hyrcaniae]